MNRFFTLLLLLFPVTFYAQEIDSINTDEEALSLVQKMGLQYKAIYLLPPDYCTFPDSIYGRFEKVKHYEKADFDNNGHTDLLFNGFYRGYSSGFDWAVIVILSFGSDSFVVKDLTERKYNIYSGGAVVQTGAQPMIRLQHADYSMYTRTQPLGMEEGTDTLIYAFNEFIENHIPAHHSIEKFSFNFECGFSMPCHMYLLTVTRDSVVLEKQVVGSGNDCILKYIIPMDSSFRGRLYGLLNRINFPELKDEYYVNWTDDASGLLLIEYDNGKVKRILDYGMTGTLGLKTIQNICMDAINRFSWRLIGEKDGLLLLD